ncbi:phospholipase, patatin family, partial [Cooperia oncophora]
LSIEQTRRIFLSARYITFCGNTRILPKHDSKGLEDVLRQAFGSSTTMGQITCQRVMVTAAKVKAAPPQLVLFRNYAPRIAPREYEKYGYMNPSRILAWKAARATSAAPVFFESYHGLADGAIFCNNPCLALITDFCRLQKLERHKEIENNDQIGCIISIGCGVEPVLQLGSIDVNLSSPFAIGKDFMNLFGRGKNLITLFLYQVTSTIKSTTEL